MILPSDFKPRDIQSKPALTADGINGLVLDAELVAVDRSNGKVRLRAFQELSTRARGGVTADQVHPFLPFCITVLTYKLLHSTYKARH